MSTDKKTNDEEIYSVEPDNADDPYARELSIKPTTSIDDAPPKNSDEPRPKTFHSKRAVPDDSEGVQPSKRKRKLSHAETSGVAISAVMLIYSLVEADKPLFFVSASLLTFLLRPLIGALFGKHNRAVQNALHSFSVVLFIGALIMIFL
ncbi:MAG: hypothetical protein J5497_04020 [Selenomonadaceae bacterium]|nr:hypothetical protein [Selenomonadaceae bacterium]